ncbi:MAG: hypothetical protein B7Z80_07620 [Rhodospirillales bacterium 20-64-7]|nr:MAG: hypothetical protein B7Z80_07620 [Rhodospirillales bacterium 20-64-7]
MSDDPATGKSRGATAVGGILHSNIPRFTYRTAAVAAIGGSLFGYDIGVISGAENLLKAAFHLSAFTEELAVAAVLVGAIIGGVIGGTMADWLSRRRSLFWLAVLYVIGAVATSLAPNLWLFIAFRICVGVAVGASSMVVPMYIAELAPARARGGLVILQQLAISGGIFISYVVDYGVSAAGWGWRPMFAAALVPGVLLGLGMFFAPHSPRWLAMRGEWEEAERVVKRIDPDNRETEMQGLHEDVERQSGASWRELLAPGTRGALIAGVGLAVFQQFVGPNTVLFYTPTIFHYAGIGGTGAGNALLPTIYVGAALFVFVLPTILLVDRIGRKALFFVGLSTMGAMLVLLGAAFATGPAQWGIGVMLILLVYVAAYSISISPLFWLMSAEVFPNRLRGLGSSCCTVANWSSNLLISVTFLSAVGALGKDVTFWIYAAFAALGIVFVAKFVPETKGRPLEMIGEYWKNGREWPTR